MGMVKINSGSRPMTGNSGVEPSCSMTAMEVVMAYLKYYHNFCQKGVNNISSNLGGHLETSQI